MTEIIANPASFTQGTSENPEHKKVQDMKQRYSGLFKRMDEDKDLYRLKPYEFKNEEGQAVKAADNVTLNAPSVYADKVQSALVGATRTPKVESKTLKDNEKSIIARFIAAVEEEIEEQLSMAGEPSLYPFIVEQACMRGRESVRVAILDVDGKLKLDVMPYDTRYFVNRFTKSGLKWAAGFSNRSKLDIKDEYDDDITSTSTEVVDYWDDTLNKVWAKSKVFISSPHDLGFVPIACQLVPVGTMMKDTDNLKYQGESIYRNSRKLFPELNKTATILQSLNVLQFRPAVQRASSQGEQAEPLTEYPYGPGKAINVEIQGGIRPMPLADIHAATRLFYSVLESYLQRATLPAIDFGNLSFPLSAVAIGKLTENKDQIYVPRLHSIARLYRQIMRMVILMLIKYEGEIELGAEGHKETFNYKNLQGEYTIKYNFETLSPEQDIANYAVAIQASKFYDEETILKKILHEKHPEEIMDNRLVERAAMLDPAIMFFRTVHSLIEKSDIDSTKQLEAKMMLERLGQLLIQRQAPGPTPMEKEVTEAGQKALPMGNPDTQGQGMMPLFGAGQGSGHVVGSEGD